jgi:hypothetical protein
VGTPGRAKGSEILDGSLSGWRIYVVRSDFLPNSPFRDVEVALFSPEFVKDKPEYVRSFGSHAKECLLEETLGETSPLAGQKFTPRRLGKYLEIMASTVWRAADGSAPVGAPGRGLDAGVEYLEASFFGAPEKYTTVYVSCHSHELAGGAEGLAKRVSYLLERGATDTPERG